MKKSLKLLLVDPASDIYINLPNMSLAYAATVYGAPVIDQHILPYPKDRFMKYEAEVLGISLRSFAKNEADRVIRVYSRRHPGTAVKSLTALDVQCCYPFLKLKEDISLGIDFSDDLPFPKYELLDSFNYLSVNWQAGLWHYPLLTSLGCPYGCIFCASRNRRYQTRSVDNCITELSQAQDRYGIVSFEIIDDVFNLQKVRVMEFCQKVSRLKLSWACSNGLRADRFDEEVARALKEAGCRAVGFGIESADPSVLKAIDKGESLEDIEKAVKMAHRYFSEVKGYFIIGLAGSDYQKDLKSVEWAKKNRIKPEISYYVPDSDKAGQVQGDKEQVFYGSMASPVSSTYPLEEQKKVYLFAKKELRSLYQRQNLPFRLIYITIKSLKRYNFKSLLTIFMIGPKRLAGLILKGEVQ